jgi:hypothetical protein
MTQLQSITAVPDGDGHAFRVLVFAETHKGLVEAAIDLSPQHVLDYATVQRAILSHTGCLWTYFTAEGLPAELANRNWRLGLAAYLDTSAERAAQVNAQAKAPLPAPTVKVDAKHPLN